MSCVDSVQKAIYFNKLGADVIVIDTDINRDMGLLLQIKKATTARLKLMPNLGCIYKCPFKNFHRTYTSHLSMNIATGKTRIGEKPPFFQQRCSRIVADEPYTIFQSSWIRPEDLRRYSGITNYFKISTRNTKGWNIISRAYIEESWDGNLLDLIVDGALKSYSQSCDAYIDNRKLGEYNVFDKLLSCDQNCDRCDYCRELAATLITQN
jgi:collagenase-like PrtC family protease